MSTLSSKRKVSGAGRVKRGTLPPDKVPLTRRKYRRCLPELKRDFEERCAYCMRSLKKVGDREIQVDHFDPRQKEKRIQNYQNLFLADAHCNGSKSDSWPGEKERMQGIRFLNCCEEQDYGTCIFEDPATHELVGTTPAAIYHIETIDLNAPHLIKERKQRAEIRALLEKKGWLMAENVGCVYQSKKTLEQLADDMIPPIPVFSTQTAV
jgi:hypothetical protein